MTHQTQRINEYGWPHAPPRAQTFSRPQLSTLQMFDWPCFFRLIQLHEAMSHAKSHGRWACWVDTQRFLVVEQRTAEVLLVVRNTRLAEERWNVVRALINRSINQSINQSKRK